MQSQAILILNQEEAVRNSLKVVLADEGYRCFTSASIEQALKIIEEKNISLIVLDYVAVNATLLNTLQTHYPATKSIVITSYASLENCRSTLKEVADEFILKPLDFDELLLLINKISPPHTSSIDR